MFETIHIQTRVEADGRLRVDLPIDLPPDSEVSVTVSKRKVKRFATQAEWDAHVDQVAGSIPDIKAPERLPAREVEPL